MVQTKLVGALAHSEQKKSEGSFTRATVLYPA
jgi:hypothetical protein